MVNRDATLIIPLQEAHLPLWILIFRFARLVVLFFVQDINRINNNTIAEFGYHDDTNRVTIKIVDKDTKETIKEIPPEKTLDLIAKAWELAGILVDERR